MALGANARLGFVLTLRLSIGVAEFRKSFAGDGGCWLAVIAARTVEAGLEVGANLAKGLEQGGARESNGTAV